MPRTRLLPARHVRRLVAAGLITALAAGAAADPASATLTIHSFALTPTTMQAGSNPDVAVNVQFSSPDGDTPRDATISLAAGLLANPSVATQCTTQQFQAATCPGSSQVGDGTITGTAPSFGTTLSLPIGIYMLAPQSGQAAQIGVIAYFFDYPVASIVAPVNIRTTPDIGIDIPLTSIPSSISGTSVQVSAIDMRLYGVVNGQPFTRNPTSCGPAVTRITVDSYAAPSTQVTASSPFTPNGCASLTYNPQLSGSIATDSGDDGVSFTASVAQAATEAATQSVSMALPAGLAPRFSALSSACTAANPATCPPIGTAIVTTPLLSAPLQGSIVLVSRPAALPAIDAIFPAPFAFTLQGVPSLAGGGLSATFNGLPDVPITNLQVSFSGGPSSLFAAGGTLCSQAQTLTGDFVAQSSATAHVTASVPVSGSCPPGGGGGGTGGGGTGGGGTGGGGTGGGTGGTGTGIGTQPGGAGGGSGGGHPSRPTGMIALTGVGGKTPKLTVSVFAGKNAPALSIVAFRLAGGLRLVAGKLPRGLIVKLDGQVITRAATARRNSLTFSLGGKGRTAVIALTNPALQITRGLISKVRHHHAPRIVLLVTVKDAKGKRTTLRLATIA